MSGIWIRSQDGRRIVCCTDFLIDQYNDGTDRPCIRNAPNGASLGVYLSEARATQVLNDIEYFIRADAWSIYTMPKE